MGMPRLVPRLLKGPFTVGDYHRMAETGVLRQDARVGADLDRDVKVR